MLLCVLQLENLTMNDLWFLYDVTWKLTSVFRPVVVIRYSLQFSVPITSGATGSYFTFHWIYLHCGWLCACVRMCFRQESSDVAGVSFTRSALDNFGFHVVSKFVVWNVQECLSFVQRCITDFVRSRSAQCISAHLLSFSYHYRIVNSTNKQYCNVNTNALWKSTGILLTNYHM